MQLVVSQLNSLVRNQYGKVSTPILGCQETCFAQQMHSGIQMAIVGFFSAHDHLGNDLVYRFSDDQCGCLVMIGLCLYTSHHSTWPVSNCHVINAYTSIYAELLSTNEMDPIFAVIIKFWIVQHFQQNIHVVVKKIW